MVDTAAMAVAMVDTAEIVVVEDLATALEAAMADLVAVAAGGGGYYIDVLMTAFGRKMGTQLAQPG